MTENNQIITGMDVWQINVPVVSKRSHGIGDIEGGFEVVLLRLRTEAGLEGWGEAACWSVFTGSPEASFLHWTGIFARSLSEKPLPIDNPSCWLPVMP